MYLSLLSHPESPHRCISVILPVYGIRDLSDDYNLLCGRQLLFTLTEAEEQSLCCCILVYLRGAYRKPVANCRSLLLPQLISKVDSYSSGGEFLWHTHLLSINDPTRLARLSGSFSTFHRLSKLTDKLPSDTNSHTSMIINAYYYYMYLYVYLMKSARVDDDNNK